MDEVFTNYRFLQPADYLLQNQILNAGYECRRDHSYCYNNELRGPRTSFLIQLTLSGGGCLQKGNTKLQQQAGSIMMVEFPSKTQYYFDGSHDHWELFYFILEGAEVQRILRSVIQKFNGHLSCGLSSVTFKELQIVYEKLHDHTSMQENSLLAYKILATVYDYAYQYKEAALSPEVKRVLHYIHQSFASPLTIEDLAAHSGLSRSYFSRRFKKEIGIVVMDYILKYRLNYAVKLLGDKQLKVQEIAKRSGFPDANYFARVFRKYYSVSPVEYRRTIQ
ncbi:MAG: AraC family transcriptional regulator [Lentisphaeria bacterium]|nr:AraC family transcriptional regulator [Lentisphaeria bacterium]